MLAIVAGLGCFALALVVALMVFVCWNDIRNL